MIDVPEDIRPRFLAAGWHPGRRVTVSDAVPPDHPAAEILATFGGLTVAPDREGEECAPSDLAFQELELDEFLTGEWDGLLRTRLIGVAEVHGGHGELYVATDGRCFGRSMVHDAFYYSGASFAEAVRRIMFGRRSQPLLRPNQSSITLYGDRFTAACPQVYRYG